MEGETRCPRVLELPHVRVRNLAPLPGERLARGLVGWDALVISDPYGQLASSGPASLSTSGSSQVTDGDIS